PRAQPDAGSGGLSRVRLAPPEQQADEREEEAETEERHRSRPRRGGARSLVAEQQVAGRGPRVSAQREVPGGEDEPDRPDHRVARAPDPGADGHEDEPDD